MKRKIGLIIVSSVLLLVLLYFISDVYCVNTLKKDKRYAVGTIYTEGNIFEYLYNCKADYNFKFGKVEVSGKAFEDSRLENLTFVFNGFTKEIIEIKSDTKTLKGADAKSFLTTIMRYSITRMNYDTKNGLGLNCTLEQKTIQCFENVINQYGKNTYKEGFAKSYHNISYKFELRDNVPCIVIDGKYINGTKRTQGDVHFVMAFEVVMTTNSDNRVYSFSLVEGTTDGKPLTTKEISTEEFFQ